MRQTDLGERGTASNIARRARNQRWISRSTTNPEPKWAPCPWMKLPSAGKCVQPCSSGLRDVPREHPSRLGSNQAVAWWKAPPQALQAKRLWQCPYGCRPDRHPQGWWCRFCQDPNSGRLPTNHAQEDAAVGQPERPSAKLVDNEVK